MNVVDNDNEKKSEIRLTEEEERSQDYEPYEPSDDRPESRIEQSQDLNIIQYDVMTQSVLQ